MADDNQLSSEDIKDLQDAVTSLPTGDPRKMKLAKFLASRKTDFEKQSANQSSADYSHGLGQPTEPERLAGRVLSSAGLPTSVSDVPSWASNVYNSGFGLKPAVQNIAEAWKAPSQRSIVNAVPFAGPLSVSMADAAKQGDYAGAGADLAGALAVTKAIPQVKPGLRAAKSELIDATRTPEGKLNTGTKIAAKIGGAAVGHTLGIPGAGEIGGYFLGPQVADALLPSRPSAPNFFGGAYTEGPELGSIDNPGPFSKLPMRLPSAVRGDPFAPPTSNTPPSPYERSVVSGNEPLVVTPSEAASLDQLQAIAEQRARERGMQYAGGVRTAGKNKAVNRLFPPRTEQ